MSLYDTMIKNGHQMFRWRSYIPLLLIAPLFLAMKESLYFENMFGDTLEDVWVLMCFLISLSGLAIRIITVGFVPGNTSGRNTKEQRADVLNTSGMYSVVRNPLYLGNFIIILGVLLSIKVWWLALIGSMVFFIYMERIILTEEKYLSEKFGATYDAWCKKTPVIIPNFRLWHAPDMKFSYKTVLKREYPGLLNIGIVYFIIEFVTDVFFEHEALMTWLHDDIAWPIVLSLIAVTCLTLRYLKKHTTVLKVEGR